MRVWKCVIGEVPEDVLPSGSDSPMRRIVEVGYHNLVGQPSNFIFSGWGGSLSEIQRAVVENREPTEEYKKAWYKLLEYSDKLKEEGDEYTSQLLSTMLGVSK